MEFSDKRVLILGAGFGGLYAAMELERTTARDPGIHVTIVNRENHSLFTPMLHEVAASDLDMTHIVNPIRKLLKHVQFFNGEVQEIDLTAKRVTVLHGRQRHAQELGCDHLVIALGSTTNFFGLAGLERRSLTIKSLSDAIYLRNHLIELLEQADFERMAAARPGHLFCGNLTNYHQAAPARPWHVSGAALLGDPLLCFSIADVIDHDWNFRVRDHWGNLIYHERNDGNATRRCSQLFESVEETGIVKPVKARCTMTLRTIPSYFRTARN